MSTFRDILDTLIGALTFLLLFVALIGLIAFLGFVCKV
jgi:hypothetical protein